MVPGMATPFPPFDGSAPKQQQFSSPPEMGIDPDKRYTATMDTSMGDALDASVTLRNQIADGAKLGALLFLSGPMFTSETGHGTEFLRNLAAMERDLHRRRKASVRLVRTLSDATRRYRQGIVALAGNRYRTASPRCKMAGKIEWIRHSRRRQ